MITYVLEKRERKSAIHTYSVNRSDQEMLYGFWITHNWKSSLAILIRSEKTLSHISARPFQGTFPRHQETWPNSSALIFFDGTISDSDFHLSIANPTALQLTEPQKNDFPGSFPNKNKAKRPLKLCQRRSKMLNGKLRRVKENVIKHSTLLGESNYVLPLRKQAILAVKTDAPVRWTTTRHSTRGHP